jgi:hypothetical protein
MGPPSFLIPQGTLDMHFLPTLSLNHAYGYEIAQCLEQIWRSGVRVNHQLAAEKHSRARRSDAVKLIFEESSR